MRKLSEKTSVALSLFSMVLLLQFGFSISCIQKEREALLQFKKSFDDPSRRLASWNGTDCCNWNGVGCNQTTGHVTMIDLRNDYDQVHSYSPLYSNSIDFSLFEFKYLNYLDLSGNNFNYTQIPNLLSSIVELRYLNLSRASFFGKIPPHLGNLTKLNALDLSFTWSQPHSDVEWISHLSSLQLLWLKGIDFSKASNLSKVLSSLPLLSSLRLRDCSLQNINFSLSSLKYSLFLSKIQFLDLSDNQLSGPTPKFFQNMTSLKSLNLSINKFTAIFEGEISAFPSGIQLLDLSFNDLNGPIPKSFQNVTSLKFLYLSRNKFTTIEGGLSSFIRNNCGLKVFDLSKNSDLGGNVFGSYENELMDCNGYDLQVLNLGDTPVRTKIPYWLGKLKNLKSLYLQNSSIYGPIPTSLGNLSSLEYLDVSSNALTGAIPTSFGGLLNLRKLYLHDNRLEEVGEECFIQLGNLKVLDISTNLLKGILTEAHFTNLSQLHTLMIGYNELLSLVMKSNWIPPFQLKYLDATSCMDCFGSEFPQWLQTQKALVELWLSNTSLSTSLPTWFTPQNLIHLDLSHNQMVGSLFTTIVDQMHNMTQMFVNDSLPPSFCKLKSLEYLDLSNNRLSGMIRGCLLTIKDLIILDLSSNNFSGTFPYSHGNLSSIRQLFLRNNNFEGSMPIVLKYFKDLEVLDLEGNKFSGNIPTWVGHNFGSLKYLSLRGNLFNGTISSSLGNLIQLQILDLAHNQLEGCIPPNLNNLKAMMGNHTLGITIFCRNELCNDLGKNVMLSIKSSYFNYSMTRLIRFIVNIDLSNNSLVGFIPNEITMLTGLVGLNLSHNNLIGPIPIKIEKFGSLESLDLSFNQLSGPIPHGLSRLNSLGILKLSHNNLSGNIPREGHLATFNEASSFDNNPHLCGDPLPMKCATENPSKLPFKNIDNNPDQEEDKWEKWLLYVMIILGYTIGFWTVVGTLILKKSGRYAYFKFVDEANYKVHATILRSIEMLKGICIRK